MIYLKEAYKILPATPKATDNFIIIAKEQLLPKYERMGARLVAAWISNDEILFQVNQLFEFNSLTSFESFHDQIHSDASFTETESNLNELAEKKSNQLLEPLSQIFSDTLHTAMAESHESEIKNFTLSKLKIRPHYMKEFIDQLERGVTAGIPMITSLRPISGDRNSVIDIWKINLQLGYQPQEFYDQIGYTEEWWNKIREMAPDEKMTAIFPLPYSPIK